MRIKVRVERKKTRRLKMRSKRREEVLNGKRSI